MVSHTELQTTPGVVDSCEGLLSPCELRDGKTRVAQGSLIVVSGWLYCERPVRSMRIVTRDQYLGVAEFGFARPDVARALGKPDAEFSGFRALIHTNDLELGDHTLAVECVTENGESFRSAHESITLSVVRNRETKVEPALGYIDTIAVGDDVRYPGSSPVCVEPGEIAVVKGWILTSTRQAGAAAALILNGKIIPALYEFERPDLVELYGEPARRCGFVGKIDIDAAMTASAELTVGILVKGGTSFGALASAPVTIVKRPSGASLA
jgi:hypothetical protein